MKTFNKMVAFVGKLFTRKVTKVVEQAVAFVPAKPQMVHQALVQTPVFKARYEPVWVGYKRSPRNYTGERAVSLAAPVFSFKSY